MNAPYWPRLMKRTDACRYVSAIVENRSRLESLVA